MFIKKHSLWICDEEMNQKLIVIGVIILLASCFCGCVDDEKERFIGMWNGQYYGSWEDQYETEATFYDNDTVKTIYYLMEEGQRNEIKTDWASYTIENGQICFSEVDSAEDAPTCIDYEFSNNYLTITMTLPDDPEFTYVLTKVIN